MKLVIGSKNYSSWSMRPWVLMREAGIVFEEQKVRFDAFTPDSTFKRTVSALSPTGKVPVLIDGDLVVWDSLAIAEYLAERFPAHGLWPADAHARARARSVCAEMHSGFVALRSNFPMNIEAHLPEVGARITAGDAAVRGDLARLERMWGELLQASGGPLLFGTFTIADACFAPVCTRLRTYGITLPGRLDTYVDSVLALPGMVAWMQDARAEKDFRQFEEPYRTAPAGP